MGVSGISLRSASRRDVDDREWPDGRWQLALIVMIFNRIILAKPLVSPSSKDTAGRRLGISSR